MARDGSKTRARILDAANRLFYGEGIRAVSMDAIAEKAGVTKRTLYYHFQSKDDLVKGYLESRDQPNLKFFADWYTEASGGIADKVQAIFHHLAHNAASPKWKGCGFLRTAAELANMPGHPAVLVGRAHKKKLEAWLAREIADSGRPDATALARQIVVLLDGAFSTMLIHRDPNYIESAGAAAHALLSTPDD